MSPLPRPTAATKASAARASARANTRRRDLERVAAFIRERGRAPKKREYTALGIWFGRRNIWPTRNDLLDALDIGDFSRPARPAPKARGPYKGGKVRLAIAQEQARPTGKRRRCESCTQVTAWGDTCAHCGTPWVRTRRAA